MDKLSEAIDSLDLQVILFRPQPSLLRYDHLLNETLDRLRGVLAKAQQANHLQGKPYNKPVLVDTYNGLVKAHRHIPPFKAFNWVWHGSLALIKLLLKLLAGDNLQLTRALRKAGGMP
ncbi:hypothetical protein [Pseudomonas luteola]|uniref:Uncharacterized protein n=1 Tax=Pseudomonas luteola TaxID=47886 RepID=A0ABS0MZ18_PSELU|nr:hypothetical protein [Pseudomonas luteola]MBH3440992.1 hypothetical protein [Pseudomonas luteola]